MKYHLAELNLARFRKPIDDPVNADFINNLDRVNAAAEAQPGFIWRLKDDVGDSAYDLGETVYNDPKLIPNLSVWKDIASLTEFAFHNAVHQSILRRRREWFDKLEFYLVLWWIEAGHIPTLEEANDRLKYLEQHGHSAQGFTFRNPYPAPV